MFNWRKPTIFALLYLTGSKIPHNLKEIKRISKFSPKEIKNYQEEKLKKLLLHAQKSVPYYRRILKESRVVINGKVHLENFKRIPILTKDIIRREKENLYSRDHEKRKSYKNTSGGSTGEPVEFLQDSRYEAWNTANKLYFFKKLRKDVGEREIKLWGSDRDTLEGTMGAKEKLQNFLYNRTFLNTFDLTRDNFEAYTEKIHNYGPAGIWAYYDSMFEIAKYINKNRKTVYNPKTIVTTIGKLSNNMYKEIKKAFPHSMIVDQYGSRETGALAIQFKEKGPLVLFPWSHVIEVIDEKGIRIFNKEGRICVTTLENYSMPLIRYEIGDLGIENSHENINTLSLHEVTGRTFAHFIRQDGALVHAQFFVTLMFHRNWIKKFQFIQRGINDIFVKIQPSTDVVENDIKDITRKIKKVMGKNCKIKWEFVRDIKPIKSGKYLYTICEVK